MVYRKGTRALTERGFHWLAQMPDGRFVILYADPVLRTIHHQRGQPLEDYKSAMAYARAHNLTIRQPELPGDNGAEPKRYSHEVLTGMLIGALDEIFAAHPDGASIEDIANRFRCSFSAAYGCIRQIVKQGHAEFLRGPEADNKKLLYPNGTKAKMSDMTLQQTRALRALSENCDAQGFVSISQSDLARASGISLGVMGYLISELCRKGYVEAVGLGYSSPGYGNVRKQYRVLKRKSNALA